MTYGSILDEFGRPKSTARRAYARFIRSGIERPPRSPFMDAIGGLLVGSDRFIMRMRHLLDDQPEDPDRPQLQRLRSRPTLDQIVEAVSGHFGHQQADWSPGRRIDDASRAVAAYLARRRFGYPATAVARAFGYRGHSSVNYAVRRVETGNETLKRTVKKLERGLHY